MKDKAVKKTFSEAVRVKNAKIVMDAILKGKAKLTGKDKSILLLINPISK